MRFEVTEFGTNPKFTVADARDPEFLRGWRAAQSGHPMEIDFGSPLGSAYRKGFAVSSAITASVEASMRAI